LTAKKVLSLSIATNEDIDGIIKREKLTQVSDEGELAAIIDEVVSENGKAITEYLGGKQETMQFLVGQVMRKTKGKANPQVAKKLLEEKIKEGKG
jgi:aspartyl-tRNA(Asn)/glutamyl-tRNA(Gln) amidotransferase subunit B